MFFEGIEKKAEIYVDVEKVNLHTCYSDTFWQQMAASCGAQIISSISNQQCRALLLSESSLFVWPDKVLIVTCGATELVKAVAFFLSRVDASLISGLIYQRKNEHVSSIQNSHFFDDIVQLDRYITGQAYRFGQLHDHHNYLYLKENTQKQQGQVFQLLVYQLNEQACEFFTKSDISGEAIRAFLGVEPLLKDFVIDEHLFKPCGYSLNAIKDNLYITIHVTPNVNASYISFEANFDFSVNVIDLLSCLKPTAFDLLGFNIDDFEQFVAQTSFVPFVSKSLVKSQLCLDFSVHFASFVRPQSQFSSAVMIPHNICKNSF